MAKTPELVRISASKWRSDPFQFVFASALIITFAVTIGITAYLVFNPLPGDEEGSPIRIEIIKSLLQFAFVIIIGGVVAAIFKALEQNREQVRLLAATRADYLNRLGKLYRTIKAARRALRAEGLTTKFHKSNKPISIHKNQLPLYRTQMEHINEAQLELEELKIEAGSLPVFKPLKVSDKLEQMEKYVRDVLKEFEEVYPLLQSDQPVKSDQLNHLDEFTDDKDPGSTGTKRHFHEDFAKPYDQVIKIISGTWIV
jgi:hypothetical protein